MPSPRAIRRATTTRAIVKGRLGALGAIAVAFLAVAFLATPALARVPPRLLAACAAWVALAVVLELLSMLGFVAVFALVFGTGSSTRQRLGAGLRALGAITVLPAGALAGPAVAARTARAEATPLPVVARSTIALTILTNAPSLLALGGFGVILWLGWLCGPHRALLTLPAAGVAVAIAAGVWLIGRSSPYPDVCSRAWSPSTRWRRLIVAASLCRAGASEARRLLAEGNWKLAGAIGYYAFDNAVLWAAFHAYGGRAPAIGVIVMGYLVGSLGAVVPSPVGVGAVEGGLIGALVLYGAPAAAAAAAVLLYRGISLSLPLALGALAWGFVPARRLRSAHRRLSAPGRRSARSPNY